MTEGTTARTGLLGLYFRLGDHFERWAGPIFLLGIRFWMARIFFISGYGRAKDWGSQSFLFESIHPVPGLPPMVSAYITTAGELILPALLMVGLFSRFAAAGLLVMAMVIQFVVANTPQGIENKIGNVQHYYWMFLCLAIMCFGAGRISIDALIKKGKGS